MKDPSAPSSINVNKYFPQPRSIRIKDGKIGRQRQEEKSIGRELCLKRGLGRRSCRGGRRGENRPVKLVE